MCGAVLAALVLVTGCTPAGERPAPSGAARTRDVGLQLFQWTWNAIGRECTDSIGPAGYAWVLTSPPQEHVLGLQWWTAYQPVSYQVESRLGTRAEYRSMIATCHAAGVKVVADAVVNHMTGQSSPGVGWAGSAYSHYDYPGLYSDTAGDFHHCGLTANDDIASYKDATQVRFCELVNLADLATETQHVRSTIVAYLTDLRSLGIDGFRIDAAKHMPPDDIKVIVAQLPPDTLIVQEVIGGSGEPIAPDQYTGNGLVDEFGWGKSMKGLLSGGSLSLFKDVGPAWGLVDSADAVIFVDNHDTERNGSTLSYKSGATYLLANVLMLASTYGTPEVHSGYAFESGDAGPVQDARGRVVDATCSGGREPQTQYAAGTWVCQHRWRAITGMVGWRAAVGGAAMTHAWDNGSDDAIAFGRGALGFVVVDAGTKPVRSTLVSDLPQGTYCDVVSGALVDGSCTGAQVVVGADGGVAVDVLPGTALAIHVGARLGR
jgi:alpha-amylase